MITELLRHPTGTARAAERPDGRVGGLPDLTRAELIAALQPRHEDRVSPGSTDAEVSHNRSRLRQRSYAGTVGDHPFMMQNDQVSAGPAGVNAVVRVGDVAGVGVPVVDGVHI
jgi:hypothetical protein